MTAETKLTAPVDYIERLDPNPNETFEHLMRLDWQRRDQVPRDELYYNDTDVPYTYGKRPRTYRPTTEWDPYVRDVRALLEARLGCTLDVCFLNRYLTARDQLGWHADDSPEMDPDRPIVTVSYGAEREIKFWRISCHVCGTKTDEHDVFCSFRGTPREFFPVETLLLAHGSAAIMRPGMQRDWLHRIPKSPRSDIGSRISLTFRGYLPQE